jgi:hypothetical protein
MLAACLARPEASRAGAQSAYGRRWVILVGSRSLVARTLVSSVVALSLLAGCVFTTEHTLLYSKYDLVDQQLLNFVVWPSSAAAKANSYRTNWVSVKEEAARLDALHLRGGAIMVDNFNFCVPNLILQSKHPKQFTIPNDQDFVQKMGAPYQAGVRYLLVPSPTQLGLADALNREWPTLYEDGAGIAQLVGTVNMSGCLPFHLYKVVPSSS